MPKVSVVIPNYNHARFLERRIQSVLDQTFQDFELIYLDDASTDASPEVFARFAGDPRVRAVLNEHNGGSPFKQWNRGVREAAGEYVWIAEADDFADPRLLQSLVEKLDQNPNVGIAYCQSWTVDENDALQFNVAETVVHLDPQRWTRDFVSAGRDECRRFLVRQNTLPNASGILFRRSVYERAGCADESLRMCGDWMLWIKMLLLADVAFVAEPLNFFRKHSGSVTHKSTRNGLYVLEWYGIVREVLRVVPVAPETLDLVCGQIMDLWRFAPLSEPRIIPWRRQREIYRAARAVDPRFHRRFVRKWAAATRQSVLRQRSLPVRAYWFLNAHVLRHFRRAGA